MAICGEAPSPWKIKKYWQTFLDPFVPTGGEESSPWRIKKYWQTFLDPFVAICGEEYFS